VKGHLRLLEPLRLEERSAEIQEEKNRERSREPVHVTHRERTDAHRRIRARREANSARIRIRIRMSDITDDLPYLSTEARKKSAKTRLININAESRRFVARAHVFSAIASKRMLRPTKT